MIKTPLSTVIGGAFWTPKATIVGSTSKTLNQIIKSLFANNEQGFAYDPNDLSTMFQDAAGIVPVTAAGQPVGLMKDKSGRNNHAFQTTSASRPILRQNAETGANYLEFDGSDDFLQTSNIDFTGTDKVSLFAGVRKLSDAASGILAELSTSGQAGSFYVSAPHSANSRNYALYSRGSAPHLNAALAPANYLAPISNVISAKASIGGDSQVLRIDGGQVAQSFTDQGVGNYGNYPLYIGRRAGTSIPFNGHIYGLIGVGKLVSDDETLAIEKELAKRTGVALNA